MVCSAVVGFAGEIFEKRLILYLHNDRSEYFWLLPLKFAFCIVSISTVHEHVESASCIKLSLSSNFPFQVKDEKIKDLNCFKRNRQFVTATVSKSKERTDRSDQSSCKENSTIIKGLSSQISLFPIQSVSY